MDKQRIKTVALLLAALCLLGCMTASLASCNVEHECSGENCLLCLCVSLSEQLAGIILLPASLCFLVTFMIKCGFLRRAAIIPASWTPVCLKVKLSD